jgi:hypothetical protein
LKVLVRNEAVFCSVRERINPIVQFPTKAA